MTAAIRAPCLQGVKVRIGRSFELSPLLPQHQTFHGAYRTRPLSTWRLIKLGVRVVHPATARER
jgi:hypothetical protein